MGNFNVVLGAVGLEVEDRLTWSSVSLNRIGNHIMPTCH